VIAAVCCLHCRHRCRNDVALDLSGLLLPLQWAIYFSKHLVRVGEYIVVLCARALLPLIEVVVVALIFVKFDEWLIGVMYLVFSSNASIVRRLLAVAPSAYRGSACTSTFLVLTNWL
jgi:hypothetical protein